MELLEKGIKLLKDDNIDEAIQLFDEILNNDPDNIKANLNKGIALFENDEFDMAIDILAKVVKQDGYNAEAHFYLGNCYSMIDKKDLAIEEFTKAIHINDKYYIAFNNRGLEYYEKGMLQEAIADLDVYWKSNPKNYSPLLQIGNCFRKAMRFQDALSIYNRIIKEDLTNINVYLERGILYTIMRKNDQALEDFEKVLTTNPNHLKALIQKGKVLYATGDRVGCEEIFNDLLEKYPENFDVVFFHGFLAQIDKRNEQAFMFYKKALELNPKSYAVHLNLSKLFMQLKNYQNALGHIEAGIKINDKTPELYYQRGEVFSKVGLFTKAIEDYDKFLSIFKNHRQAIENRARCLVLAKRYEEAREVYTKILESNPKLHHINYYLGWSFLHEGKELELAIEYYNKALEANAEMSCALTDKAIALSKLGRFDEAEEIFESQIEKNKLIAENYINLAQMYVDSKNIDKALEVYDKLLEINDREHRAYFFKGNILHKQGDNEKAIENYTNAIDLKPKFYDAIMARGFVKRTEGDLEEALADFNLVLTILPKSTNALYNKALVLKQMEQYQKAIDELSKCIDMQPKGTAFFKLRAECYELVGNNDKAEEDKKQALQLI